MARFVIELNETFATIKEDGTTDWIPAMLAVAYEISQLNNYVGMLGLNPDTGESAFPRPITCDPDAVTWVEESSIIIPAQVNELGITTVPEYTEIVPAHWEGQVEKIIGDFCTPPTEDGFVTVEVANYEWINFRFLVQLPTTFFIIGGEPKHVGKII